MSATTIGATNSMEASTEAASVIGLSSYVGFDTITQQIERKLLKRGFALNIMLVGSTGLGKSTLLNSLFSANLVESKARLRTSEPHRQTTEIIPVTHCLEENGVRLKLTVVDTPGYGDLLNNEVCMDPIIKYIRDQFAVYLRKELTATRDKSIADTRIHCVLFFISPTGHSLKPLDIVTMRQLSEICNVVPVIAKSDALTIEERVSFKNRIRKEIEYHGIRIYPPLEDTGNATLDEQEMRDLKLNQTLSSLMPFAIIGSQTCVTLDSKPVRGRRTRSGGLILIENEKHCEFVHLRNFLMRTHLQDLIESTCAHYEAFRTRQLISLKETRDNKQNN